MYLINNARDVNHFTKSISLRRYAKQTADLDESKGEILNVNLNTEVELLAHVDNSQTFPEDTEWMENGNFWMKVKYASKEWYVYQATWLVQQASYKKSFEIMSLGTCLGLTICLTPYSRTELLSCVPKNYKKYLICNLHI